VSGSERGKQLVRIEREFARVREDARRARNVLIACTAIKTDADLCELDVDGLQVALNDLTAAHVRGRELLRERRELIAGE
jgi:hypothetical protein